MAEISWTEEAQRWLTDIFEYIAADNPQAAARTVEGSTTGHRISRDFLSLGVKPRR
jgi:toxin ParE1/3/4